MLANVCITKYAMFFKHMCNIMTELVKTLSAMRGAGLMLNIVVGAGLLALPGLVVDAVGKYALWAWAICAFAAIPLLSVFIIMGKRFPNAGGIAHFSEMAFGSAAYIVTSVIFLGAVTFGLPAIALTGGYYLSEMMPAHPVFYAALIILAAAGSHLVSTEIAGKISSVIASGVLISLICLVIIGAYAMDWANIAQNTSPILEVDVNQVLLPFMMIFFAFTGWEVAASISEEFKNPKRDFPRAMIISFVAACFLYFSMAFIVQNTEITGSYEASFTSIAEIVFGKSGKIAVSILAAIIIFANLMGAIWAVSRMILSLSREGYLPFNLKTNGNGSPISAVLITSAILLIVLSMDWLQLLDINEMLSIAGQNFLILYGITGFALFRLSQSGLEKILSAMTILIVAILLFLQAVSIFYPICLSVAALIIWYFKKKNNITS